MQGWAGVGGKNAWSHMLQGHADWGMDVLRTEEFSVHFEGCFALRCHGLSSPIRYGQACTKSHTSPGQRHALSLLRHQRAALGARLHSAARYFCSCVQEGVHCSYIRCVHTTVSRSKDVCARYPEMVGMEKMGTHIKPKIPREGEAKEEKTAAED